MFPLAIILVLGINTYFTYSEVVIACEGTTLDIACSADSMLQILDANYGRTSSTVCPKLGLDSNKDCKENVTKIVSQRCDYQSSCSINATNDVFQDPCIGTYKYLEVNYACIIPVYTGPGPVVISNCGENEERGCVSSCNKKCQNRKVKRVCPNCLDGCVCKPGYIEDTLSGMCVGDKYCPLPDNVFGSPCDTHEQYSQCDAACQPTCTNRTPKMCTTCVPGYVCDQRYLRDTTTGKCVLPSQCS